MSKRPLGRGLSALISTGPSPAGNDEIREIELDLIRPGQQQPRTTFDQAKLEELAQSIVNTGVIQPLLVRPVGGLFELVAGERRWRAAQLAGLHRIPAIVREIPNDKVLELALIENIQRAELNPVEEANAYKNLTNYLRVLKLPGDVQELIEREKISFGHARALLGVSDPMMQRRLAQKVVKHNWSVRETERRVKYLYRQEPKGPKLHPPSTQADPNVRAAETKLRRTLGTQVRIVPGREGSSGRIEIEYYGLSDLDRLFKLITQTAEPDSAQRAVGM
jgi:ParB family chromosome partitioning protein